MIPVINRGDGFNPLFPHQQSSSNNYLLHQQQLQQQSLFHQQQQSQQSQQVSQLKSKPIDPLMAQAIAMLPKPPTYIPSLKCTWNNQSPLGFDANSSYQAEFNSNYLQPSNYYNGGNFYVNQYHPFGRQLPQQSQHQVQPQPHYLPWARAPGAERRSIDLSTLPPPPIDLQLQANANAQAYLNHQAVLNDQSFVHQQNLFFNQLINQSSNPSPSNKVKNDNSIVLSGFAAEAIWDICWSSSPAFGNLKVDNDQDVVMQSQPMHHRQPSWSVYAGGEDMYGRPKLEPTVEFRRWTYSILTQTALSKQALFLALFYASHLPIHDAPSYSTSTDSAPYRLLTISLALANRWLDDNTYTNKTWSEVTGLSLRDIGLLDRWALADVGLNVNISTEDWTQWMYRVRAREQKVEQERLINNHHNRHYETSVEGYTDPMMVINCVDECLRSQFSADHKHAIEFSPAAIAARHRHSPNTNVEILPLKQNDDIDLDENGPLRQYHHHVQLPFNNVDGNGNNNIALPPINNVTYEDESWGRMGNRGYKSSIAQHQYYQQHHQFQQNQQNQQQYSLGGGLGLGGFNVADYRRSIVA